MPVIFSHNKFINFTVQTAAQQADIVAPRLSIAAAAIAGVWRPASQSACGRPVATGGPQADWLG